MTAYVVGDGINVESKYAPLQRFIDEFWQHSRNRIKLRQASEALCDTPLPLKRIAEDLGFASEAGLHRAFRKATGQTPLAYRMAHGAR